MPHRYLELLSTPAVLETRARLDRPERYASALQGPDRADRIGPKEAAFVAERDGFYLGTVSASGWPYVQFRGGPRGFLRVLDEHTLGWAEYGGNRQYLTVGNLATDDRASLFLMDYVHRRRLKLLGRLRVEEDPERIAALAPGDEPVERAMRFTVEGLDWNCPQHIPQRLDAPDVAAAIERLRGRIAELEAENRALRAEHPR